jgi:hypothetical protein
LDTGSDHHHHESTCAKGLCGSPANQAGLNG